MSVAREGRGTFPLEAVLSAAELVCSAEALLFETLTGPLVRASPFCVSLLELFDLGMMIFSKLGGFWMLSAHRQREDHNDLHRWHNNISYSNKL